MSFISFLFFFGFFSCLLFGVFLPWQVWSLSPYEVQRAFQGGAVVFFLLVSGFQLRHPLYRGLFGERSQTRKLVILLAGLLIVLGVILSPWPFIGLLELTYLLSLGSTAVVLAMHAFRLTRFGWGLLGGLMALFMLVYAVLAIEHVHLVWDFANARDFAPGFAQQRFLADVAVGLMPLSLLYVVGRRRPSLGAAILCLIPLTIWWWLLGVAESRAAVLGLVVGVLVTWGLLGRGARWLVGLLSISAAVALVGWWYVNPIGGAETDHPSLEVVTSDIGELFSGQEVVSSTAEEIPSGSADSDNEKSVFMRDITSSTGRYRLWSDALGYGVEQFPLGIGPMGYAGDGALRSAHAHNLFLNTAAEWGIPLALLMLCLLGYGGLVLVRRARVMPEEDKPVFACLSTAFIAVMVNAQFAGSHIIPMSALVMVLAIGSVFGFRSSVVPLTEPALKSSLKGTILWLVLMLMIVYLLYAGMELHELSESSRERCFHEQRRVTLYPRFWAQGRLECMQMVAPEHWLFRAVWP